MVYASWKSRVVFGFLREVIGMRSTSVVYHQWFLERRVTIAFSEWYCRKVFKAQGGIYTGE